MSISGPRPHPIKMNDDYKKIIDKYMIRHFLKPGITGWAQVSGYRGETKELKDIQGRIEHDIWYMENWSFLLDLKIIFLTVYNVIKGEKNAY
jgi:putative colanic acid biosysnthesis UDP-glucose lipid carrier transferase